MTISSGNRVLLGWLVLLLVVEPPLAAQTSDPAINQHLRELRAELPFVYDAMDKRLGPGGVRLPRSVVKKVVQEDMRVSEKRERARGALIAAGTNTWPAIPGLLDILLNRSSPARMHAMTILAGIHAADSPGWSTATRHLNKPQDRWLLKAVEISILAEYPGMQLGANDQRIGIALAAAFGPSNATNLAPVLNEIITRSQHHALWPHAAAALHVLKVDTSNSTSRLVKTLLNQEEWPDQSVSAARALVVLPNQRLVATNALFHSLQDSRTIVRIRAAEALHRLGVPAAELVPVVAPATAHRLASVRLAATKILNELAGSETQP